MHHTTGVEEFADAMRQECLGTRVSRLQRIVARRFDQALRPLGLSMPQLEILSCLVLRGAPTRPSELAEILCAERSTISRNLAALQDRGWIEAATVSASGRSMAVTATDEGERVFLGARAAWSAAQAALMDQLGPESPTTIDAWLATLA